MKSPHQARKRFGQNFLTDQTIINHIINSIKPNKQDNLIEIGPGLGALTQPLLTKVERLQVIEIDRDVIPLLQKNCHYPANLIIHQADALKFDFNLLTSPQTPMRLLGNLPYNISTPLLFHFLKFIDHIQDLHFMLQKEVVERLCAKPNSEHYGRLSVMIQYFCQPDYLFTVPATAFHPQPKVESAIVRLTPHHPLPYPANDFAKFSELVRLAFNQRRKTIRNSMKPMVNEALFIQAGIDPGARAETLALADFVTLSNLS
ncbi:MAG: 16S rRNA (adenine(1518)-N(6)/adenine(1519)-N(6))-dimethyltransferase RsmA [Legionellales bacterium]|nr:16S rRNA (adenine(1518)-N(6)/adenine(1519)-N(6))-dimethyltransferase RsmA [Legionellales bacterium]